MERKLTSANIGFLSSALLVSGASVAQYSPQQSFTGKTGKTLEESIPAKIEYNPKAVAGSPNVVWILIDDAGFGATTPFGGLIETPNIKRLADNGLRFTNFHTTGISSPTRAALLTGRNHHSAHIGLLTPAAIDFPGYDTYMPFEKATVAEILRDNGYNTFALGKWHVAPVVDNGPAGPFNRWPTGRGFDNYFGFLTGATDQWHPELWEDQTKQPQTAGDKHLNELLADKAIKYIANQKSGNPAKPFFLYLATGATHSPHQVAKEWIDKYKGKFDEGWDVYREKVIKRQKEMGIIPSKATLPEHNTDVKPWRSLSPKEQKAMVRFMETYAGFYSYTDYEIGRIVDYLDNVDLLDNTVFIVILGDNGASRGGGQTGNINPAVNRLDKDAKIEAVLQADNLGSDKTRMDYPVGWAQAANTPFRWYKANANSEGGTRNPVIIHYPNGIKDKGGIRHQYGHVTDILPTTLDILGIQPREVINGYRQQPVEGVSVAHSFEQPDAPSKHLVQYFEIASGRAIYKDGWKATAPHIQGNPPEEDVWELYNLNEDFNERINLAERYPEKLKELQDVFDREAKKYNIYPLKDFSVARMPEGRTIYGNTPDIVLYPGVDHLWGVNSPLYERKSFIVTAFTEIVTGKEDGVLFAVGGDYNGVSLFIKDEKLYLAHKNKDVVNYIIATEEIPTGEVSFRFDYEINGPSGGQERLFINDKEVGTRNFSAGDARITGISGFDGTDAGKDLNHPVSDKYASPFPFTGKLKKVKIHYTKLYSDDLPENIGM